MHWSTCTSPAPATPGSEPRGGTLYVTSFVGSGTDPCWNDSGTCSRAGGTAGATGAFRGQVGSGLRANDAVRHEPAGPAGSQGQSPGEKHRLDRGLCGCGDPEWSGGQGGNTVRRY